MSENNGILLSVITPAYNRAHLLTSCFESLNEQTDLDFEWIIVDDGSTDSTPETVRSFDTDRFPIVYINKPNGGKHTALNAAHDYIRGKYVLIMDSDDVLTSDAVSQVRDGWGKYENSENIGVVTFLRGDREKKPLCTVSDWNTPVDILRYKRTGIYSSDCCEVIRTELFKKYPFPVFEGEKFVAECALWNRVAQTHKCVYINRVIYICEYLEDGLTRSGRAMRIRNPLGGMFTSNLRMIRKNFFTQRVKYGILYTCYGFFAGMDLKQMASGCLAKALMWMCTPAGWCLYHYWKKKHS